MENKEIQGTILCERECIEENISWTPELVLYSDTVGHNEVDVYFQRIEFTNAFDQAHIPSGDPVYIELPRDFKSDGGQFDVVLWLKKILYGQAKAIGIWYEFFRNGLLDHIFVASKVYPCLIMSKTVICVVYVYDCLFWEHSKYDIDNLMKSLN